ncbi:MAG: hypothetical protein OMM_04239 [Candidatus Magnetoglobus multicellularis str. Araruama]|uniref:Uncharacterized protein n=1 Tax=Candidatus Magnetoglobus multicellularis str. Araruama TaxID=890399 RepID=A0A1V1P2F4_9BACT|nr:MAG: hypothetical protein OMM_04239 [Candidatus Magnetoglobus multicellularis str. Araruama]
MKHDHDSLNQQIFRKGIEKYVWILAVNPKGNMGVMDEPAATTLSWDSNILKNSPDIRKIQLKMGNDDTGEVVIEDMRETDSYDVNGMNEEIYFSIVLINKTEQSDITQCINIDLLEGWNLVSIHGNPVAHELTTIFSDAEIAYGYTNGSYYKAMQLFANEGYWVKMPFAKSYQVCAVTPVHSYSVDLTRGWHLQGCTCSSEIPGSYNDQIEVMYEYRQGAYARIYECTPGFAFWVRLKAADTFFVSE